MPQNDLAAKLREVWKIARDSVVKLATPEGATEPDLNLLRDSFHDEFTDVYDEINGQAYNAGSGKNADKLTKATAKLKVIETERDELRTQLEEAQAAKPDVEKIKKGFEKQLAAVVAEKDETIASLGGQLGGLREDRDLGAFEKSLVEAGLKPRAAAAYRAIHAKQFSWDDEGNLQVKQAETGTPYLVPKGAPFAPLVKQLRDKADPDDVVATVDRNGAGAIRRGYGAQGGGVVSRGPVETEEEDNKRKAISYGI